MTDNKHEFICPKCKHKITINIPEELNEDNIDDLLSRSYFKSVCKHCHNILFLDYPVKLRTKNYYIYYTPTNNKKQKQVDNLITRVCDTYDDFKEKILILNDNLNDIIVELLKSYIKKELKDNNKYINSIIRYDSKNEENLVFTLVDDKQNVGISLDIYNQLLESSKIKKINKGICIDNTNYFKYIK